ncbi:hypothetical protein D5S17_21235 [Pseudonocardiaceae bacterium YIM PH 21723]|nr:hypothetical protein D5S17_21235 [Pseudonocardiaceae bacterium YIM PH 21723]
METALKLLATARARGWTFVPLLDESRALQGIDGYFEHPGFTDALRIRSDTDVTGIRCAVRQAGDPGGVVWQLSGLAADVIHEMLSLPNPASSSAPRLVSSASPDWSSRSPGGLWIPG